MTPEGCFTIQEGFHSFIHSSIPSLLITCHVSGTEDAAMNKTAPNLSLPGAHILLGVDGEQHKLAK